jgi:DNA-binding transcriptional MocR family regulator
MDPATTRYQQLADAIVDLIRAGTLVVGDRLPSVRVLARRHEVSVSTAVQAYRWLEDAQWVQARPRAGYFVSRRPPVIAPPRPAPPALRACHVVLPAVAASVVAMTHDPAIISFGAACPNHELFDNDRIRRTVNRTVQRHRRLLTHYPIGPGQIELRQAIARYATSLGCALDPARVLITSGALEAIATALRATTKPGDIVALESPCYFGFLEVLQALHLKALEIPCHPTTGLCVSALKEALRTQPIRAVVVVPTLSNPSGSCMPQSERRRLARLVAEHDIPLIEDVVYNDYVEEDALRRAVKSHDTTGHVILCGSFSKSVAPGIRLGWVEAGRWKDQVQRLRMATSSGQSPIIELALAELLNQPGNEKSLQRLRRQVRQRMDFARQAILDSFPAGTRVSNPAGGFILWLQLPDGLDSQALYQACLAEGICIAPGSLFTAGQGFGSFLRLGVGGHWGDAERNALTRIGRIASTMLKQPLRAA